MKIKFWVKIIISLTFLFIVACQSTSDRSLSGFFDRVSNEIENKKLENFKDSDIDSTGRTIDLIFEDIFKAYNKFGLEYDLGLFSDSIGRKFQDTLRVHYLSVAYHLYCNNKDITIESTNSNLKKMSDYEWRKQIFESAKKDDELVRINSLKFKVGDTVNVCLLIDNDISVEYHHYYCGDILSDDDYFSNHVSTGLSGVLLSKTKGDRNPTGHDLIFNIKVLSIEKKDVMKSHNKFIKVSETFELNVTKYRRIIDKGLSIGCSEAY